MGKRPRLPTALHSELSEYSSLLRALRTSNTLDLAAQLTVAPPTIVSSNDADDEADDGDSERPPTESVDVVDVSRASSSKPKAKLSKPKPKNDTWTRWPLLAGDVHVPEWSLEDEVKLLALQALRGGLSSAMQSDHVDQIEQTEAEPSDLAESDDGSDVQEDDSEDHEEPANAEHLLTPRYLSALTSSAGSHLACILALLAAYVPPGEKSMQNRVHPIGWQSVLDIVAVNGLVDQETVDRVKPRLTALYPSTSSVQEHVYADDEPLRRACAAHDMSFLTADDYVPEAKIARSRRKRGPYRTRKTRATVEPHSESFDDRHSPSHKRKKSAGS